MLLGHAYLGMWYMLTQGGQSLFKVLWCTGTGKSFPEALIFASVNPQYDNRLFIELRVQYEKNTSLEHVVYKNCIVFWHSKQFLYTTCSELVLFLY